MGEEGLWGIKYEDTTEMPVALNMWNRSNKEVPGKFSEEYKNTQKLKHAVNSAYKSNQVYDPLQS